MTGIYEEQIKKVYNSYFEKMGIDEKEGILIDKSSQQIWNRRFSTFPYIGSKYGQGTKILFLGMDVGADNENQKIETLEERKKEVEACFLHESFLKGAKTPNPHMLGTMLCALHELNHSLWNKVKDKTRSPLKEYREELLKNDPIPYIALTNVYKYSSIDREKRRGSQDRIFLSFTEDLLLLKQEIEVLKPEIIFLQGADFSRNKQIKNFLKSIIKCKVYPGYHPSAGRNVKTSEELFSRISEENKNWKGE